MPDVLLPRQNENVYGKVGTKVADAVGIRVTAEKKYQEFLPKAMEILQL